VIVQPLIDREASHADPIPPMGTTTSATRSNHFSVCLHGHYRSDFRRKTTWNHAGPRRAITPYAELAPSGLTHSLVGHSSSCRLGTGRYQYFRNFWDEKDDG